MFRWLKIYISVDIDFSAKTESVSHHTAAEKDTRENHGDLGAGSKNASDGIEEDMTYCPRKHKAKHRALQEQVPVESHVPIAPPQTFKKPTNPYEIYMVFKKKVGFS